MDVQEIEIIDHNHAEIYRGYEISIKPNADHWRGGFEWSVSKNDVELDCGLEFTARFALNEAYKTIGEFTN